MAQVTLPYNLTAGSPENVNNLMSNLNALKDGVNTIDTAQIANSAVTPAKAAAAVVTSLPTTGLVDGIEVSYQSAGMATDGVVWRFKYRSGSSSDYKWEFVGGQNLFTAETSEINTGSTSWGLNGLSLTAPLKGIYMISFASSYYNSTATDYGWTGISVNSGSVVNDILVQAFATSKWVGMQNVARREVSTAAVSIQVKHQVSSGTGYFGYRTLGIVPVRVG